jgi:hypothetical protein
LMHSRLDNRVVATVHDESLFYLTAIRMAGSGPLR